MTRRGGRGKAASYAIGSAIGGLIGLLILWFGIVWFVNWPANILSVPLILGGGITVIAGVVRTVLGLLAVIWPGE